MFSGSKYGIKADAVKINEVSYIFLVIGIGHEFPMPLLHAKALHKILGLAIEKAESVAGGTTPRAADVAKAMTRPGSLKKDGDPLKIIKRKAPHR